MLMRLIIFLSPRQWNDTRLKIQMRHRYSPQIDVNKKSWLRHWVQRFKTLGAHVYLIKFIIAHVYLIKFIITSREVVGRSLLIVFIYFGVFFFFLGEGGEGAVRLLYAILLVIIHGVITDIVSNSRLKLIILANFIIQIWLS